MRKGRKYIKRILVIGICLILSISIVPVRKNVKATQGETPQPDIDILIDLDKDGTYETNIEDVDNLSPGTYNLCIKLVNNGETALSEPWNGVHIQVWKDYVGNADSAGLIQSVDMGDFYTGDMWVGPDWCSEQYISTPAYFKYTTAYPDGDTDPDPIFRDPFCGSQISRNEAHGFELNIEGDFSNPAYAYFTVDFSEQATYYICYRAWLDDVDDTIYNPYYNEYSTYVARDPYDVPYSRHHFWYDTDASEGGDEIFDFGEYNCYTKEIVVETVPSSVTGKIVYASDESGNYDIWLMDLATGAKVQLTDEEYDETLPYWSPNGNKIAYLLKKSDYEHEIWVMDADGSNKQKIATIASGGQLVCTIMGGWLDDNNLVFSKVDGSVCHHILYKVDLNGNVQSILDPNDIGEGEIWFADYNPITKKLVFEAQSGCWDPTMDIYVADYDVATNTISNIVLLFSSENHYDGRPRISPDGQKVVFVHRVAEGAYNPPPEYHDLWVVNIDGSDPHPITSNFGENYNMRPTFVDDDTIIFFAKKEGAYDLWMMDLDGSNPTKLTNTPYNETWPDFYPVSEIQNYELIFSEDFSGDLTEKWDLVIFNSAGGSDNDAPPTTRSDYGNPPPCFDNKGDSWCGNAIFSKQTFDYSNGLIIECDMWVKDARYEGCWVTPIFGIARELPGDGYYRDDGVYIDNDHCDPKCVVSIDYVVYGPACWMDPDKQGHAGIWYKVYNESGEVESYFEFPADDGLEEWHTFKIYIRPDRHVEFYKDGELVYTTHSRISMDYNNMPLVLGTRSHSSYGPALHDNVKVYKPPVSIPRAIRIVLYPEDNIWGINKNYIIEFYDISQRKENEMKNLFPTLQDKYLQTITVKLIDQNGDNKLSYEEILEKLLDAFGKFLDTYSKAKDIYDWYIFLVVSLLMMSKYLADSLSLAFSGLLAGESIISLGFPMIMGLNIPLPFICNGIYLSPDIYQSIGCYYPKNNVIMSLCPVNITIIDEYGRIISDTGVNEIPNAFVFNVNETKAFFLPANLSYSIEIDAYEEGIFNFTSISPIRDFISISIFKNISVTASTKAYVEVQPDVAECEMRMDYNGDGTIDEEIQPDISQIFPFTPFILSYTIDGFAYSAIVGDVDNDGLNELVIMNNTEKQVRMYCSSLCLETSITFDETPICGVIADVDNDGKNELIVGTSNGDAGGYVYVGEILNGSFAQEWKSPLIQSFRDCEHLAVGDANNNGYKEIAVGVGYYGRYLVVYEYNGNGYTQIFYDDIGSDVGCTEFADVDNDGIDELIVGTGCWSDYSIRIYDDYTLTKEIYIGGVVWLETGDVDGDGFKEIIAACGTACGCGTSTPPPVLRIIKWNGTDYETIWTSNNFPQEGDPCGLETKMFLDVGNLLYDNKNEIAALTWWANPIVLRIYSLIGNNYTCIYETNFTDEDGRDISIGDYDNDGQNELIIVTKKRVMVYEIGFIQNYIRIMPPFMILPKSSETTFNIMIDNLPNGLSGYNITISLSNSSVAEIEAIEFPEWALLHQNSSLPSSSAWIKAVDLDDEVKEGERNVVLATITIKALNEGITSINIDVNKLDDDNGYPINVSIQDGILNVIGLQPLPGFENPPTDPDNDGLFEDLNGNGLIDFDDVVEFFKHFEWIENNYAVNFIDFNLNSRIDFDDVVELFKEV